MELEKITQIQKLIHGKDIVDSLKTLAQHFEQRIAFSTSFGWEDQVLTHIIFSNNIPIRVFTLDTGRMFPETYLVWNRTNDIYNQFIQAFYPDAEQTEQLLTKKGPLSFYDSVENRKECCEIRKVLPLKRALQKTDCWITGIRADQSAGRQQMQQVEWDAHHKLIKVHPLFNFTIDEIKNYIRDNNIPYNSLHDKGFLSIGCAPCTRAVKEGEEMRAGRWWWEDNSKKECGLHS